MEQHLRENAEIVALSTDRYDIVVAGGAHDGSVFIRSEIYNTETRVWREGPLLPEPIFDMASVQYEDSFLLVGGFGTVSGSLDTIYQYNQTSETWILRPERLSAPKYAMGAVLAQPSVADCS